MSSNKKYSLSLVILFYSVSLGAQNTMRIHYKGGGEQDISVSQVDSVTFVNNEKGEEEASLTGSWFWGSKEIGYYELLTFGEDHSYTGYDNYFTYGFDMMTYGYYSQTGIMLSLWSNGYGYQRHYGWYIIGITSNALEVMTRTGPFTYYRLQPEVITLGVGQMWIGGDGDEYVFADNVVARITDNKLIAIAQGETYIQKKIGTTGKIVAYKVVIK